MSHIKSRVTHVRERSRTFDFDVTMGSYDGAETCELATSFPGSSLFLPPESTLVAAGHVSARFLQIPEM